MITSLEMKGSVGIVRFLSNPETYINAAFKNEFEKYTEQTLNFVVDLGNIQNIDVFLSSLVACLKIVSDKGGDIRLVNLNENIRMVFEITRAWKIFEIFDDIDNAVKSYEIDK